MNTALLVVVTTIVAIVLLIIFWHFYCRISIPSIPLQDANILITGASEGIGFSMAKACVERGANVAIVARNKQKLSSAAEQLSKLRRNPKTQQILTISADVSDYKLLSQETHTAFEESKWSELHGVVCNAGVELVSSFENTSIDEYHRIMNINYFGTVNTIKVTLPFLKRNKLESNTYGRVLVVSSLLGLLGMAYYTAYCASKWALRGFVESIFAELASMNIYASIVYPPDVNTSQHEREKQVNIPQSVKDLSSAAAVFEPDDVGRDMMVMFEKGTYNRSWGFDAWMLVNETVGFGIIHSLQRTLAQVFGNGLFRAIAMWYAQDQYHVCKDSFGTAKDSKLKPDSLTPLNR